MIFLRKILEQIKVSTSCRWHYNCDILYKRGGAMQIYDYSGENCKLIEFIESNLNKSSFILNNLMIDDKVVRYLKRGNDIIGMYIIIKQKFATYLFSDNATIEEYSLLVADANNYHHLTASVINPILQPFVAYYIFDDDGEWCEVANVEQLQITPKIYDCEYQITKLEFERIDDYMYGLREADVFPGIIVDTIRQMYDYTLTYVMWDNNKIIGAASLTTGDLRMQVITDVYINPKYEGQHLATTLVSKLLVENQKAGGIYSIFFTNPVAKHIYLNLGFEVSDKMLLLKSKRNW